MSLRSPLGRVRGLGSARTGVHHWWHQRTSAVALVPLSLWFVYAVLGHMRGSHAETVSWISSPFITVLLVALLAAMFYHAKLGLQVVIEDYVHHELAKLALITLMNLTLALGALLGVVAVLKIAFVPL